MVFAAVGNSATVPVTLAHGADLIARVGPSQAEFGHCDEGFMVGTGRTGGAAGAERGRKFELSVDCCKKSMCRFLFLLSSNCH